MVQFMQDEKYCGFMQLEKHKELMQTEKLCSFTTETYEIHIIMETLWSSSCEGEIYITQEAATIIQTSRETELLHRLSKLSKFCHHNITKLVEC